MRLQLEQSFHPNGQLRCETCRMNGRLHGITRRYHPNGQLEAELPYDDGLPHGVAKFWAIDGRYLGDYKMEHGTGIVKMWHQDGSPRGEVPFFSGLITGRQRSWDEVGEPCATSFWIRGKKVTRKKYLEACKADPDLPRYSEEE